MADWGQMHVNSPFQIPFADIEANQLQNQQQNVQQSALNNPFLPFNVQHSGAGLNNSRYMQAYQQQIPTAPTMSYQQQMQYPCASSAQNPAPLCNLPANILEQIRSCANASTPIFILPNGGFGQSPATNSAPPAGFYGPPLPVGPCYPPVMAPYPHCPSTCHPYPISYPVSYPIYDPFSAIQNRRANYTDFKCDCCKNRVGTTPSTFQNYGALNTQDYSEHRCDGAPDGSICSKKNCPSSIQLQAMVAQLLSIQGIVPCAVVRLILRRLPASNITNSDAEIVDRAQRAIQRLNKDQLLAESKSAQQTNALIGLFLASNPIPNVIPILTLVQLKINIMKTGIESLINAKLMENQGVGAEASDSLDPLILGLKSDDELREFLAALRDKECVERVNLNFAPYRSQRIIAETRLANIQNKINQVEAEMDKRRNMLFGTSFKATELPNAFGYCRPTPAGRNNFESPNPFAPHARNPKRLFLRPNVGSPATTYANATNASTDPERCQCGVTPPTYCTKTIDTSKKKPEFNEDDNMEGNVLKVSGNLVILVDYLKQQSEENTNAGVDSEQNTEQDPSQKTDSSTHSGDQSTAATSNTEGTESEKTQKIADGKGEMDSMALVSSMEHCHQICQDESLDSNTITCVEMISLIPEEDKDCCKPILSSIPE